MTNSNQLKERVRDREPYLSVSEVARLCSVSPKSVYRWAGSGAVRAYRAGRQFRFKRAEVEAYLERDMQHAPVVWQ